MWEVEESNAMEMNEVMNEEMNEVKNEEMNTEMGMGMNEEKILAKMNVDAIEMVERKLVGCV